MIQGLGGPPSKYGEVHLKYLWGPRMPPSTVARAQVWAWVALYGTAIMSLNYVLGVQNCGFL